MPSELQAYIRQVEAHMAEGRKPRCIAALTGLPYPRVQATYEYLQKKRRKRLPVIAIPAPTVQIVSVTRQEFAITSTDPATGELVCLTIAGEVLPVTDNPDGLQEGEMVSYHGGAIRVRTTFSINGNFVRGVAHVEALIERHSAYIAAKGKE